jgi:hypothetical protein
MSIKVLTKAVNNNEIISKDQISTFEDVIDSEMQYPPEVVIPAVPLVQNTSIVTNGLSLRYFFYKFKPKHKLIMSDIGIHTTGALDVRVFLIIFNDDSLNDKPNGQIFHAILEPTTSTGYISTSTVNKVTMPSTIESVNINTFTFKKDTTYWMCFHIYDDPITSSFLHFDGINSPIIPGTTTQDFRTRYQAGLITFEFDPFYQNLEDIDPNVSAASTTRTIPGIFFTAQ